MAKCDQCGKTENMPYKCRHCGGTYCADHRLPENHGCPGLENWGDPDGVFDSGFDDSVDNVGGSSGGGLAGTVDTGPGSFLGYFRGNMTFVFLALMWVTFAAQLLVGQLIGMGMLPGRLYTDLFMLSSAHPEYLWTWLTSIFAHGGFGHIAMNSIVIYFFGQLVEKYVGSREFAVLFVVSGMVAGLAQIGVHMLTAPAFAPPARVLGASGAGLAIMGVLTVLNPGLRVYLYFLFPVPIWALTGFYAAISALAIVGGSAGAGGIAHAAHLVGLLVGLTYGQHVKSRGVSTPGQIQFGGGGPGGPGGPGGRRRGPF